MPKILTRTLFSIVITMIAFCMMMGRTFAQCDLTTTIVNDITVKETPGNYNYARTAMAYEAVDIKSGVKQHSKDFSYYLAIEYTSQTVASVPIKLLLRLSNGQTIALNMKFAKNIQVDDKRTSAKTLEVYLTEQNIASVMASPVSKISFKYIRPVNVPPITVADPGFLQAQLTCLKTAAK